MAPGSEVSGRIQAVRDWPGDSRDVANRSEWFFNRSGGQANRSEGLGRLGLAMDWKSSVRPARLGQSLSRPYSGGDTIWQTIT